MCVCLFACVSKQWLLACCLLDVLGVGLAGWLCVRLFDCAFVCCLLGVFAGCCVCLFVCLFVCICVGLFVGRAIC